ELVQVLEEAHVVAELRGRLREAAEGGDDLRVDFARVGMPRDRVAAQHNALLRDELLEAIDLRFVALEEVEERRLRAGRAFDAEERERLAAVLDLGEIEGGGVQPEPGALADG